MCVTASDSPSLWCETPRSILNCVAQGTIRHLRPGAREYAYAKPSCRLKAMHAVTVAIAVHSITDWPSFHDVFQRTMGFPSFYGRNMDAWIDCMTSLDAATDGMTTLMIEPGGLVVLSIEGAFDFERRCPEQYDALLRCTAFVNFRRTEIGQKPVLALLLNGRS